MKALKLVVHSIRFFFGYLFLFLASYLIPDIKTGKAARTPPPVAPPDIEPAEAVSLKPIPFTDLTSYVTQLAEPNDPQSAVVSIIAHAKKLSAAKQTPIRLNIITTFSFDDTGDTDVQSVSNICSFDKGRWYKLRDIDMDHSVFLHMLGEMIESQTQDGWACMDDSSEQVSHYLFTCLEHNRQYLIETCRQKHTTGAILLQMSFVVDMTDAAGKNMGTAPQILVRVKATVKDKSPMESSHSIYFNRISSTTSTLG